MEAHDVFSMCANWSRRITIGRANHDDDIVGGSEMLPAIVAGHVLRTAGTALVRRQAARTTMSVARTLAKHSSMPQKYIAMAAKDVARFAPGYHSAIGTSLQAAGHIVGAAGSTAQVMIYASSPQVVKFMTRNPDSLIGKRYPFRPELLRM